MIHNTYWKLFVVTIMLILANFAVSKASFTSFSQQDCELFPKLSAAESAEEYFRLAEQNAAEKGYEKAVENACVFRGSLNNLLGNIGARC